MLVGDRCRERRFFLRIVVNAGIILPHQVNPHDEDNTACVYMRIIVDQSQRLSTWPCQALPCAFSASCQDINSL